MRRQASLLLAIVALVTIVASLVAPTAAQDVDPPDPGPEPAAIGEPVAPLTDKRVYDMANLLNNEQEASIESDANRLARHGIPNVVVVHFSTLSPEEAGAFAAEIRRQWGVESSPGADDGLVLLVSINDTEENQGIVTTLSWGDNALPHYGVTSATAADIKRAWLDRYIDGGNLFEGIVFALRRLIYHSIYDPAPQAPLTGARADIGAIMPAAGIALAAGALALAGWCWSPQGRQRRPRQELADLALQWGVPILAAAVFALSVAGRSGWGVAAGLVLLGIAMADWVARDPRQVPETRGAP